MPLHNATAGAYASWLYFETLSADFYLTKAAMDAYSQSTIMGVVQDTRTTGAS
jgi:hypothetical protein